MNSLKPHGQRYQEWKADMILRHGWFRVLLHLEGIARCPRHARWHWNRILGEFH